MDESCTHVITTSARNSCTTDINCPLTYYTKLTNDIQNGTPISITLYSAKLN